MASNLPYSRCIAILLVLTAVVGRAAAAGYRSRGFQPTPWKQAFATFYGDETASATMGEYSFLFVIFVNYMFKLNKMITVLSSVYFT